MDDLQQTELESLELGPLPLARALLERLDVPAILARRLPANGRGRPREIATARLIELLVANVMVARQPLYAIAEWLATFVPEAGGFDPKEQKRLNDDRIGRALDRLFFHVDLRALATDLVVTATRRFGIRLDEIHNDSTTVTFHGRYHDARRGRRDKAPPQITYGFNKDHRPDLKQLVFELSTSGDGAVPVHFRVHDGNVTDDQTHRDTWMTLCELIGRADFLYVADSKLATSENMRFIDEGGGRFLSVLPRTRKETADFRQRIASETVAWQEVYRQPDPRHPKGPEIVYEAVEGDATVEGYRMLWYRSSQKVRLDQQTRADRLDRARVHLGQLEEKLGRRKLKDPAAAQAAANEIIEEAGVEAFLAAAIHTHVAEEFEQIGPGRPGPETRFHKVDVPYMTIEIRQDAQALADAARGDGIFPLVTNDRQATLAAALRAYKEQPFLERRHEQFKHALDVMPMNLKTAPRVAALLSVYFIALLAMGVLEREVRRQMKRARIASLPLYPEERLCKQPTAELVLDAFRNLRRHRLLAPHGAVLRVFHDRLPAPAHALLDLLAIDPALYGVAE